MPNHCLFAVALLVVAVVVALCSEVVVESNVLPFAAQSVQKPLHSLQQWLERVVPNHSAISYPEMHSLSERVAHSVVAVDVLVDVADAERVADVVDVVDVDHIPSEAVESRHCYTTEHVIPLPFDVAFDDVAASVVQHHDVVYHAVLHHVVQYHVHSPSELLSVQYS